MSRTRVLALLVLVALLACSRGEQEGQPSQGQRPAQVAVATLMSHPALDTVIESMKAELADRGYVEGESIEYIVKNANGDANLGVAIVRQLELESPDVIVAITTPIAQAAAKQATSPLVFSAVTDPVGAGVVSSLDAPQEQITGVSDAWPYREQLQLAREIVPEARRLGVLYNPGEAASQYGIGQIREIAPDLGFEVVDIPVTSTSEILGALQVNIASVDAVYLSSDNTVIQGLPAALRVCFNEKKPLFVGDSGTVEKGGLAAVSVGYAGVGTATGELVDRVLKGERSIPIVVLSGDEIYLNRATAERIGLVLPAGVIERATKIYDSP